MRILFVSHFFQPEPNFFMCLPFAKELVRRGHEVEVLTGFPNYPSGKVYDGYRIGFLKREALEGIPICRVPLYPSHDNSSIRRTLCYLSWALSASTIGPFAIQDADVAYALQGPITVGNAATVLQLFRKIPFVLHVQDLWPDSLASTGMFNSKFGLKILNGMCNSVYKQAGKIVVIAPGMKERLMERGVPEEKIEIIYNWCDDAQICRVDSNNELATSLSVAGRFNIVFAGNMGKAQALEAVLDAAKIVASSNPQVQFVFIGSGVDVESLKAKVAHMQLQNILFLPRQPISEIGAILRIADVLLVHLRDDPLFRITIPGKTQAYMAAGRPVLIGVPGDAADLVLRADAGLACEPENPVDIARAVLQLSKMPKTALEQMGRNGNQFYESQLSFSIAVDKFEEVFEEAVRKR